MSFIHSILDFKSINAVIATAAFQITLKHLWYVAEETVVYALFSANLDEKHKKALVQKLLTVPRAESFRRRPPNFTQIIDRNTTLANIIGPESWFLLQEFGINNEWLQWPVSKWPEHQTFNDIHCFVHTVKVDNDADKRGIKLNTDYATILTDDERQNSNFIQAVDKTILILENLP